jgi:hypothetical protein
LGLAEACLELAEAYSDRLVLEEQARAAHREKLFTALYVYASLHYPSRSCSCPESQSESKSENSNSTNLSTPSEKEKKEMIKWLMSMFTPPANPYPVSSCSVFMTGMC